MGRAEIDRAIATGQPTDIRLTRKIPVAWVYLTGWMTRNGVIQFRDDVYEHDDKPASAEIKASELVTDAKAGGFVRVQPTREVKQTSYLDSR